MSPIPGNPLELGIVDGTRKTFNLATDFIPRNREWWEGGGIKVPDAKLFMERYRNDAN